MKGGYVRINQGYLRMVISVLVVFIAVPIGESKTRKNIQETVKAEKLPPKIKDSIPEKEGKKISSTKSRLSFGEPTFNFGRVPRKTKLTHTFKYGVSVVDTVRIIRTSSSCGCTYATVPKGPLTPKDTGSIIVSYKTGMVEGAFSKTFTLYTNSTTTPEIVLTIKGDVIRCVAPAPPVIHLDQVQLGSGWKKEIKIRWKRWRDAGLKKPKKIPEYLTLGTPHKDKSDSTLWYVPVSLSSKVVAKYYLDTLAVPTADSTWPLVKIPVQGTITDVVTTKPLVVNMGQVKVGKNVSNSFVVVSSVQGAKVEKVTSSTGKITAQIGKVSDDGKTTRINLSTSSNPEPGSVGTDIMVTVRVNGKKRELKVPVVGRFLE